MNEFTMVLETSDYVFYSDFEESDENGNTKMYNKDGKLLSDNYFAYNELMNQLESINNGEIDPIFIHDYLKNYMAEMFE